MGLRWKKKLAETGLSKIGSGPRGSYYHDGSNEYSATYASGGDWRGPLRGWYWMCPVFRKNGVEVIPYRNTHDQLCETEAEAKKQAADYVKKHINAFLRRK